MVLKFWWLALILLVIAGVVVALLSRPRSLKGSVPVAYTRRITSLPGFVARKRRILIGGLAIVAVTVLGGASALAGISRPITTETINPQQKQRDVMLCLDASGSMSMYNAKILDTYADLIKSFKGERIGMTVFNSAAVSVFPLTTDYEMATEFIEDAQTGFESHGVRGINFFDGTVDRSIDGSSLIGDGLASCLNNFDRDDEERSRSVIFATDNQLAGEPIYKLMEAAELAKKHKIRVYALAPKGFFSGSKLDELKQAAETTDGEMFTMGSGGGARGVIQKVQQEEAALTPGDAVTLTHDHPAIPLSITGILLLIILGRAWGVKL